MSAAFWFLAGLCVGELAVVGALMLVGGVRAEPVVIITRPSVVDDSEALA